MDKNGKGMTQSDLECLPEIGNIVLWQPDDEAPIYVTDIESIIWSIGFHEGTLYKQKCII